MGRLQLWLSDRILLRLKKCVNKTRMTETSPVLLRFVSLTLYSVWVELEMAGGALHCNQSDSLSEADALFLALLGDEWEVERPDSLYPVSTVSVS